MKSTSISPENEPNDDIYIRQVGKKDKTNENLPSIESGVVS
jgi:hypothetical protein